MAVKNLGGIVCKGKPYELGEVSLAGAVVGYLVKKPDGTYYEIASSCGGKELKCSCKSMRFTPKDHLGFRSCKHCDAIRVKLAIPMPEQYRKANGL